MNPKYPGVVDFGLWELGRSSCRPQSPVREACAHGLLCPRTGVQTSV